MTRTMRRFTLLIRGKNKICSKSMGWKAFAPPVLGWHQLGWANRERSNGRDFYSSACSDLLRGGRWRLKALDAGAGENESDNDPAFLTARRREYPPHTPHRYLVAARVAHRSQRGRSAARVRSPYSRCPPQVYHMAAEELFVSTAAICMCRPMCGIISGRRTLAVRRRLSRDPAMLRRPHWRSLGGRRRRSSGQTFRVWPRN